MIFARKINKIAEFYMIFARKMSELYIIIARKIFFPNFGDTCTPLPPVSYTVIYSYVIGYPIYSIAKTTTAL